MSKVKSHQVQSLESQNQTFENVVKAVYDFGTAKSFAISLIAVNFNGGH
jgi:hypothetical protein